MNKLKRIKRNTINVSAIWKQLEDKLNISKPEDWYSIKRKEVVNVAEKHNLREIKSLLQMYNNSLVGVLEAQYPSVKWVPYKFKFAPQGSYANPDVQLQLLKEIEKELNITKPEDWYNVTFLDCVAAGDRTGHGKGIRSLLANHFNNSISLTLQTLYPQVQWNETLFKKTSKKYYRDIANHRSLLDLVGKHLGVQTWEDWYNITGRAGVAAAEAIGVAKTFHSVINRHYNGSLIRALKKVYDEHNWDILKFKVTRRTLLQPDSRAKLLKKIEEVLGIQQPSDWYKFTGTEAVQAASAAGIGRIFKTVLKSNYQGSLVTFLTTMYPNEKWNNLKFKSCPKNTYIQHTNQVEIMNSIGKELQITKLEDWIEKDVRQIKEAAQMAGLTKQLRSLVDYHASIPEVIAASYPEIRHLYAEPGNRTKPLLFKRSDTLTLTHLVKLIEDKLLINSVNDWYRVSMQQVRMITKSPLVARYGLFSMLNHIYPDEKWSMQRFAPSLKAKKSQQRLLTAMIRRMFGPEVTVHEDFLSDQLIFSSTNTNYAVQGESMELDVYLPDFKLALEYNGEHHYRDISVFGSFREYQLRDEEKRKACAREGITLIEVPYTWDSTMSSLASLIKKARPEIKLQSVESR